MTDLKNAGYDIRYVDLKQAIWAYERTNDIEKLIQTFEQDGSVEQLREMLSLYANKAVDSVCDGSRDFNKITTIVDKINSAIKNIGE